MAAPVIKVFVTTSARLKYLPVVSGQLIFVYDLNMLYLDRNGRRLAYNTIMSLSTDQARTQLESPLTGYYFVEDTGVMWQYKKGWKQITSGDAPYYIFQESEENFPTLGNSKYLYTTPDAVYRWNAQIKQYECVSNKTEWKRIGK